MWKYAISMMFLAGAAVAQVTQQPQPAQGSQAQPGVAAQQPQPAQAQPGQTGQPSAAHAAARNAAIQQIEQALQQLRANSQ